MTTNNHPANGPVSLERLHQIREILSKAAAQSDGGNLGYAMADAVKVINGAIAAFGAEPVAWKSFFRLTGQPGSDFEKIFENREAMDTVVSLHERGGFNVTVTPLYTAPPAPAVDSEPVAWWTGPEPTPTGEIESIHDHETGSHSIPLYPSRTAMLQAGNSPVTQDGWIPVSERMPEDEQEVIVHNKLGYRYVSYFDEHSGLFFDIKGGNQVNCIEHILVTHWMPSPSEPQKK
nr:DUF551 domain-containing protein [Citrobacter werkmanii]